MSQKTGTMKVTQGGKLASCVLDWADVRAFYRKLHKLSGAERERECGSSAAKRFEGYKNDGPGDFTGASAEQVIGWLKNGYDLPPMREANLLPASADIEKPRWRFTDDPEGEFDFDLYSIGETDCYRERTKRITRAGIRVRVMFTFSASVRPKVIAEYGRWVGAAVQTLQAAGYDLEIELVNQVTNLWTGGKIKSGHTAETTIRVSGFGERILPREWSALFSPGGFRQLYFAAMAMPQKLHGMRVSSFLGVPTGAPRFEPSFDAESRTLEFGCQSGAKSFPAEEMTRKLAELQHLI